MARTLRKQAERQYYMNHTTGGVSPQTPFGQLQRMYMMQYIIAHEAGAVAAQVAKAPFDELEIRWIKAWITTNGGTPPPNTFLTSQWKAAVAVLGQAVSKDINDNMLTFFLNAA